MHGCRTSSTAAILFRAYTKVRLLKKLWLKLSFQLIFLHETVELSAVLW